MANEYWVKNRTAEELVVSELNLKIPTGKPVNLFKLQPNLTHEAVAKSEETGTLSRMLVKKLTKLVEAPAKLKPELKVPMITEAKTYMPSRARSAVIIDVKSHSFIEELSSFDEAVAAGYDDDGFVDPIAQATGHSGEKFGKDDEPFSANVVNQKKSEPALNPGSPTRLKSVKLEKGEVVVEPE